jgi:S1-C subfamily serine protease
LAGARLREAGAFDSAAIDLTSADGDEVWINTNRRHKRAGRLYKGQSLLTAPRTDQSVEAGFRRTWCATKMRRPPASWPNAPAVILDDRVSPSVVQVAGTVGGDLSEAGEEGGGGVQSGTGFVWDRAGHIVTNNHVVQGTSSLVVRMASGESARPTSSAPRPTTIWQ